ncbi:MAG: Gfo/Idh/MocA family oxidoreductase [Caldilineaceae bacterium SB0665_bin_25]|nr:Gfo/Idh/MocA family oxidoreductase [Caldilineaceae bacterium SB0665_bin_25]
MSETVRVGVVSTSWWADAMYLPALDAHPRADVVAVCGRNRGRADAFAARWNIPQVYTSYESLIRSGEIEALVVASGHETHYPITMQALDAGLHVLCEKPLALRYDHAAEMAALAAKKGVIHCTPFTYRFMPTNRYIKELVEAGYIGRPYHLNLRYYTGYAREPGYGWRHDRAVAATGVLGNIASHFFYLAYWWFGEVTDVFCLAGEFVDRPDVTPEGKPYERTEDAAYTLLRFASGAQGLVQASAVCTEESVFGQRHEFDLHGEEGTLRSVIDWVERQDVEGTRRGEGPTRPLELPERVWGAARRDTVHNTYRDVFRVEDHMTRGWINAIADGEPFSPSLEDGAYVQRITDAADLSARESRWVRLQEIN